MYVAEPLTLLTLLIAVAIVLMLAGFLVLMLATARRGKDLSRAEGGAVVIVGPLPIIFGTSKESAKALLVLAIALVALSITLFILMQIMPGRLGVR